MAYLGLDGKPMLIANGFAKVKRTYDEHGNQTVVTYYGVNGEPVRPKEQTNGMKRKSSSGWRRAALVSGGRGCSRIRALVI